VVEGIYTTPAMGGPPQARTSARALAGRGIEGDRYSVGGGFYSNVPAEAGARELTLIEAEVLEDLRRAGIALAVGEHRRNVLTRGIRLNDLVGREFRIGGVPLRGVKLCEPCVRLEELTGRELIRPLTHRGGLRAAVLADGVIGVGDRVGP